MFVKSKIFDVREQKEKQNQKNNIEEIKDSLSLAEVYSMRLEQGVLDYEGCG